MKVIKKGTIIPYGISRNDDYPSSMMIRLPIFIWYGRHYDISEDIEFIGWYIVEFFFKFRIGLGYTYFAKKRECFNAKPI